MGDIHFAILFKRVNNKKEIILKPLDYIEGEEMVLKGGRKVFLVGEAFKKHFTVSQETQENSYSEIFDQKISYADDIEHLDSEYVYGFVTKNETFNRILAFNKELAYQEFGEVEFKNEEKSNELLLEIFKDEYINSLNNYKFIQAKDENGNLVTLKERKKSLKTYCDLDDIDYEILSNELQLEFPEDLETFSKGEALPSSIKIKEIFESCKKQIIGQDDHILPILSAINDNLIAKSPEEKTNILVAGSTGVGKTAIFKKISELVGVPIVIENATQFTQEGYVGRSVDDIFEDLILAADNNVKLAEKGIIVIDEIDKKATGKSDMVSGIGVLNSMLKLLEGGVYNYEVKEGFSTSLKSFNTLNTTIALCGSFYDLRKQSEEKVVGFSRDSINVSKPFEVFNTENLEKYGIPPELVGRLQLIEILEDLQVEDLKKILLNSEVNPYKIFIQKMIRYNTQVQFPEGFIDEIAKKAYHMRLGARGLYSIIRYVTKLAESSVQLNQEAEKELVFGEDCVSNNRSFVLKINN